MPRANESKDLILKAIEESKTRGLTITELTEIVKKPLRTINYNLKILKKENSIFAISINNDFRYYTKGEVWKNLKGQNDLTNEEAELLKSLLQFVLAEEAELLLKFASQSRKENEEAKSKLKSLLAKLSK